MENCATLFFLRTIRRLDWAAAMFFRHFQGPPKGSVSQHRLPLSLATEDWMKLKSGAD
jgi:hypothetical protein